MQARAKHGSYLFQRPGSANWYVKLRSDGKRVEKSLGTTDRRQAEVLALPLVAEHKRALLIRRPTVLRAWVPILASGREHVADDGHRIIATERELIHIEPDGSTRTEPNGGLGWTLTTGHKVTEGNLDRLLAPLGAAATGKARVPKSSGKDDDDAILDTYIRHKGLTGYSASEARAVWVQFKAMTDNKPLKHATREDGRALVAHFESQGIKTATINKKLGWLRAAVNLAIAERKECGGWINPFAGVIPQREDAQRRFPISDADMKAIRKGLGKLAKQDQLLLRLLCCTGMRLGEAFQISSEEKERGVRFVIVGTKTDASLRRVPLPADVLPFLPAAIKGPMFAGTTQAASKRLNRFLRDCGITDPGKVAHSFRHRAKDRLRAAGCPLDVQYELLGHETSTVASGYGRGSPVPLLKRWLDKVGC